MKKLMITAGLLMMAGSAVAAETWQDGNSAPVNVTFTAPDTVRFSRETHFSFNKDSALLASTVLGAVTASKAGGDGAGIRFQWERPYKESGKGDVTDFKNQTDGVTTIAVRLKDTQGNPLIPAESDAGANWYLVEGASSASDVTVQFYPQTDVGTSLTAGQYTAGIKAAVYSN
ncbi:MULTISPECIES: hypothetical protein [Serratia]|uniref:hypothetical protein n=1 Tax=Serratia TaxID=613 RepID=UPI0021795556|nr:MULTISPECIES: hypothetical protein [Serratia]CAI1000947.1 Uncharacterised protein [Serratia quinivorans]CAI1086566.1 Uncharacterised protein [Serratia quinivorans]CAI2122294.1 Uncharacterised protein [Serratia quinivorans]CAI2489351.1 Uncharacterised protein [Serratia liquefaciens]